MKPTDLIGSWRVHIASGPRWMKLLFRLGNVKVIYRHTWPVSPLLHHDGSMVRGHNIMAGRVKWGHFTVTSDELSLILTYDKYNIIDDVVPGESEEYDWFGVFSRNGETIATFTLKEV